MRDQVQHHLERARIAARATVIGTVTDDTKAVLPGATITATGLETGVQTVGVRTSAGAQVSNSPSAVTS